jgi:hypothetical protein
LITGAPAKPRPDGRARNQKRFGVCSHQAFLTKAGRQLHHTLGGYPYHGGVIALARQGRQEVDRQSFQLQAHYGGHGHLHARVEPDPLDEVEVLAPLGVLIKVKIYAGAACPSASPGSLGARTTLGLAELRRGLINPDIWGLHVAGIPSPNPFYDVVKVAHARSSRQRIFSATFMADQYAIFMAECQRHIWANARGHMFDPALRGGYR